MCVQKLFGNDLRSLGRTGGALASPFSFSECLLVMLVPLVLSVHVATVAISAVIALIVVVTVFSRLWRRHSSPTTDRGGGRELRSLRNVTELARRMAMTEEELVSFEPQYQHASIPKRSGGRRQLQIPDADTLHLQRRILKRLLTALQAHPLACGFEEATSIVDAALPHIQKATVVRIDVRRFFESTTVARIQSWFEAIGWDRNSARLLTKLTTCNDHLPQGSPTSPRLSNLVNAPLDEALYRLAQQYKAAYTRYADDITFSFSHTRGRSIRGFLQAVRRILKSYGYKMHGGRKLRILRSHQRQEVLGLVVNSDVNLPRKTRRWLRAVRHRVASGGASTLTPQQLAGWTALESMVRRQRND